MSREIRGARIVLAVLAVLTVGSAVNGTAWAETPTIICVPESTSGAVLSAGASGTCQTKRKKVALPGPAELSALEKVQPSELEALTAVQPAQLKALGAIKPGVLSALATLSQGETETLNKILPHINFQAEGVGGKPTIQFSAVNLQIINGEGKTASVNGEGNLVIGYDERNGRPDREKCEDPTLKTKADCEQHLFRWEVESAQGGSHNLILGEQQEFESYGGIVAGVFSTVTAPFGSVLGGNRNRVTFPAGYASTVLGGLDNDAEGPESTIGGGAGNETVGLFASVSGGEQSVARGNSSAVSGGRRNVAEEQDSSVSGGFENQAGRTPPPYVSAYASVSGGTKNKALGEFASVSGGVGNVATGKSSVVSGGKANEAGGEAASISGGEKSLTEALGDFVGGAFEGKAHDEFDIILGGNKLETSGKFSINTP